MVAIGFVGSAIDYSIGWARKVGSSEAIGAVADYFSQHYSNWIDIVEDLRNYSFSIDYHMNLNFAKGLEVYLHVEPMVRIEKQRILAHHLHLSLRIQLEDVGSPCLQPIYSGNPSFSSSNEDSTQLVVTQPLLVSSLHSLYPTM